LFGQIAELLDQFFRHAQLHCLQSSLCLHYTGYGLQIT
jgi:hypothetical protein